MPLRTKTKTEKKTETGKPKRAPKKKSKSQPVKPQESEKQYQQPNEREVIYPDLQVKACKDEKPLAQSQARELLGWQMESENLKFNGEYLLKDVNGVKVRCHNNVSNRPLYHSNLMALKQEILRKRWRFNGEPIIVGKSGLILNGQHTLIAFILACQDWDLHPGKWLEWQEEPTIDKLVVYGVEEDDDVVNTLDTCKGRSQADVLFRSEVFAHLPVNERKAQSRICSYAINTLWERTGAEQAFAPRQTFAEAMDFLRQHPKLIEAVNHIYVENGGENKIGSVLSPGYASGMMYLMGCSKSDPEEYVRNPNEASLDFSNWDKAEEFFTLLGGGAKELRPVRSALKRLIDEEEGGSRRERFALAAKAWTQWVNKGKINSSGLTLNYVTEDSVRVLAEEPSVGGIDLVTRH